MFRVLAYAGRLLPIVALLVVWVLPATGAEAHAALVSTTPADGGVVTESPSEVTLTFNEPVDAPVGAIRVYDAGGERVDAGDAGTGATPEEMSVSIADPLDDGTYMVTWRTVSADGHPIKGAFVFTVGDAVETVDNALLAELLGEDGGGPWAVANTVARWLAYLGGLSAAGAALFPLLIDRRGGRSASRVVSVAATIGIAGSVLVVPFFAAEATGLGLGAFVSGAALVDSLTSSVGLAAALRIGGLVVLMLAVRGTRHIEDRERDDAVSPPLALIGTFLVVAAELATGHTRTVEPMWAMVLSAGVHVLAAAVWTGGLVVFGLELRRCESDEDLPAAATMVDRFSRLALITVAALALAGGVLSWVLVRAPRAIDTPYGWTLVAKLVVVVGIVGLALYNRRKLVPEVVGVGTDNARAALGRLGRTVRWEAAGVALVLLVTAVLVNLQPAADAAGISGVYSTYVEFGEGELNLVVDPNRVGVNEIHTYLLDESGRPAIIVDGVTFEFDLSGDDGGAIERIPQLAGPGHFIVTGPELAVPGEWEITVRYRDTEFSEITATVPVVVNP